MFLGFVVKAHVFFLKTSSTDSGNRMTGVSAHNLYVIYLPISGYGISLITFRLLLENRKQKM